MLAPLSPRLRGGRLITLSRKRERGLLALTAASTLLFSACIAQQPIAETPPTPAQKQQEAAALYLDAVKGLLEKQQYLAAIAHIQEDRRQHGDSPQLRLYEADARRNLGQAQAAQKLYESLLQDPKTAGDAQHGLGRIAVASNLNTAISHLQKAASLKPVDVDVRNDLGYALMQAGRYTEARTELATAVELAPDETKARNNLLILLMAQGDEASLARVLAAARPAVDTDLLARLRQQAQSLKSRPRKP